MTEKIKGLGLCKSAIKEDGSFQILTDISFTAETGEIVCILGSSGCGKSTLLRLIGGFDLPDKGVLQRNGVEVKSPSTDAIMVFQDFNQLLPWKTVMENVVYPLNINGLGVSKQARREMAVKYLNMVGLEDFSNSYPHQLSGGMKQKVCLARAIALQPSVLLMDEPFGSLDALTRHDMQKLLLDIWKTTGVTIIFVTHDVEEAVILSDKIIIMEKKPGRIIDSVLNDLERPRTVGSRDFNCLYQRVRSLLEKDYDQ